jgi:hypothetical protein
VTAATQTSEPAATYRFGTGAASGVWLGMSFARIAVLAVGLLGTVGLLAMRAGLLFGAGPLLVAAVVAMLPVAGRPLVNWTGSALGHGQAVATGTTGWTAPVPHAGLGEDGTGWQSGRRLRLPPECGRVRLFEVTEASGGWPIAVLRDGRSTAATLAFSVAGPDRFGLLASDDQDRLVAGWGRALATLAQQERGAVHVQLLQRVTAGESDLGACRRWLAERSNGSEASTLAATVEALTVRRDNLFVVRLPDLRDGRDTVTRARDIAGQLLAAELVARPCDAAELAGLIRRMLGPGGTDVGTDLGPVSRRTSWEQVRTDDSWHRSFAVSSWPGSPVPADWLSSLLLAAPTVGTWATSVHLGAVAPQVANRLARAARTKAELDRADRARLGLSASAAADKAVVESAGMDAELVAGHVTHRLAAVLTCTAASIAELAESARGLQDAAAIAGLPLRPLHGQHQLGLAATLPLCRLRFGGAS